MAPNNKPANSAYHLVSSSSADSSYFLLLEIDRILQGIRSARESLLATPLAKGRGEYIKPIECDQAADISTKIKDGIARISGKLKSMDKEVALSYANHYLLLLRLHSAHDKSTELNELLMRYRSICTQNASQHSSILSSLQREMSSFIQACEQIEVETDNLLDSIMLNSLSTCADGALG